MGRMHAAPYDEALQNALADLDVAIANDPHLDLIKLKTLLLPSVSPEAMRSFLDERLTLIYAEHGHRSRSHRARES